MKNEQQTDLFEWADNRPSAEIVNLQDVATRIMIEKAARGDYDDLPPWPDKPGEVVTLKRVVG